MRWLKTFLTRLKLLLQDRPVASGGFTALTPSSIGDGVNYSMPPILSAWDRLNNPQAAAAIIEANRALYANQFGSPYAGAEQLPVNPIFDDPLREWDFGTRVAIAQSCHAAYHRNPLANSITQFTADYVVGDGFSLVCQNQQVQELLDCFINNPDNPIREYERAFVIDLQVDGEIMVRFFEEQGNITIVPMRPYECRYIKTVAGFFRRPVSYEFSRIVSEGDAPYGMHTVQETIPAEEIVHAAINRHSYELRGRSDLFRLLAWLRADVSFLADRSRQSQWRGGLLWHVQLKNASAAQTSAAMAQWSQPPSAGAVRVSSDNETVTPLVNSAQASDASADGRALRIMSILGARLPEFMFADGQKANLATATKQELPALTKFDQFQRVMLNQVWQPILKRVIESAITAGVIPDSVRLEDTDGDPILDDNGQEQYIEACQAFEVHYDPVTGQDLQALVNAYATAEDRGWIDRTTIQQNLGFDPAQIAKRLERQELEDSKKAAAGLRSNAPDLGEMPDETADQ